MNHYLVTLRAEPDVVRTRVEAVSAVKARREAEIRYPNHEVWTVDRLNPDPVVEAAVAAVKDDHDPSVMRLVPDNGEDGMVTIHLPMGADRAAAVMGSLAAMGWEFEHIVKGAQNTEPG